MYIAIHVIYDRHSRKVDIILEAVVANGKIIIISSATLWQTSVHGCTKKAGMNNM